MAARKEPSLTECPVFFCTGNRNFSFAPALAYASEALLAASITPGSGVSESESPLSTISGLGAISGSIAGPSNSIVDQPHHIPNRVVKKRMFLSGFYRRERSHHRSRFWFARCDNGRRSLPPDRMQSLVD